MGSAYRHNHQYDPNIGFLRECTKGTIKAGTERGCTNRRALDGSAGWAGFRQELGPFRVALLAS